MLSIKIDVHHIIREKRKRKSTVIETVQSFLKRSNLVPFSGIVISFSLAFFHKFTDYWLRGKNYEQSSQQCNEHISLLNYVSLYKTLRTKGRNTMAGIE